MLTSTVMVSSSFADTSFMVKLDTASGNSRAGRVVRSGGVITVAYHVVILWGLIRVWRLRRHVVGFRGLIRV